MVWAVWGQMVMTALATLWAPRFGRLHLGVLGLRGGMLVDPFKAAVGSSLYEIVTDKVLLIRLDRSLLDKPQLT